MNVIKYRVSLDMFDVSSQKTIKAKKCDSACEIHITLTDHGKIYKINEGCYATFNAKKSDGNFIYDKCTIEGDTIVYDFSSSIDEDGVCQVSAVEGNVECEITLYNADGEQLTSPRFVLYIDSTVYNGEEIVSSLGGNIIKDLVEKEVSEIVGDIDITDHLKNLAIQNVISGGEKSLTVNDVSPLVHKCSLQLTSDTYEDVVGGSRNIFNDENGENIVVENIDYLVNDNGSVSIRGYNFNIDYPATVRFLLNNLTPNQTYTFSLRSSNTEIMNPKTCENVLIPFYDEDRNEQILGGELFSIGEKITFVWNENWKSVIIDWTSWGATEENGEYELTLYPQLELGDTMTDWGEYSGGIIETKSYIEDFSTVTVSVSGTTYSPNADGTVEGIQSVTPTMEITTDNEHANITDFTYCVDTKKYIDDKVVTADFITIVNALPEVGESNKIYLVPKAEKQTQDLFDEYLWINGAWEWVTTKQVEVNLDDYVKNTDYAEHNKGGVVKVSHGNNAKHIYRDNQGNLRLGNTNENITTKSGEQAIRNIDLDYAIKVGLTTNTETLTDEEKASALKWLGALKKPTLPTRGSVVTIGGDGTVGTSNMVHESATRWSLPIRDDKGCIKTANPVADLDAATKKYVDDAIDTLETERYPVGSVFVADEGVNPNDLFCGEWEKQKVLKSVGGKIKADIQSANTVETFPVDVSAFDILADKENFHITVTPISGTPQSCSVCAGGILTHEVEIGEDKIIYLSEFSVYAYRLTATSFPVFWHVTGESYTDNNGNCHWKRIV